jgi:hypothetical protein
LLTFFADAVRAQAQAQLDLDWEAPAGCPQAAAVRARVRSMTGESRAALHLRAQGRIARVDGFYRLTLSLYEGGTPRDRIIDSASCADLAGAAAVALGLWLRHEPSRASIREGSAGATTARSPSDAATGPAGADASSANASDPKATRNQTNGAAAAAEKSSDPETENETESESEVADEPARPARPRRWRAFVRAPLLALDVARLPTPSLGLGADLGLRYDDWRVGGGARIFQSQTLWSREITDVGVEVGRFTAGVWACRRWGGGRLELAPCAHLSLERIDVRGLGRNVTSRSEHVTSLAFGAGGSAYFYPTDWMALVGTGTLSFASARPRLAIEGLEERRQLGPVVLGFGLASEWIF